MRDSERQFDDPALKSAVRQAFASERAPASLRQRIEQSLAIQAIESDTGPSLSWWARWQSPIYAGIAAMVILGAIGLLAGTWFGVFDRRDPGLTPVAIQLPPDFGALLVQTHRRCSGAADHRSLAQSAGANLEAVRQDAKSKVAFPVLAISPGADWQFKGASLCSISGSTSVHVLFTRGRQTLSMFSLPREASSHCNIEGAEYEGMVDDTAVAGFTFHGALFFIIGHSEDGSLALKNVVRIRNQMRGEAMMGGCSMLDRPHAIAAASP